MSETMTLEDLGTLKGDTGQARVYEKKVDAQGRAYATGTRKDAVARVWVKQGGGKILVRRRPVRPGWRRAPWHLDRAHPLRA